MRAALIVIAATILAGEAAAAEVLTAKNPLLRTVTPNISAEQYIANVLTPFDRVAGDSTELLASDIRGRLARKTAQNRSGSIGTILSYDLNGDFRVTASEVFDVMFGDATERQRRRANEKGNESEADAAARLTKTKEQADRLFARYDLNKDGVVDVPEAANAPENNRPDYDDTLSDILTQLGRTQKLTRAEVKSYGERTFAAVDKNRDGRISQEEYIAINPLITQR